MAMPSQRALAVAGEISRNRYVATASGGHESSADAQLDALAQCAESGSERGCRSCRLYAIGDEVVCRGTTRSADAFARRVPDGRLDQSLASVQRAYTLERVDRPPIGPWRDRHRMRLAHDHSAPDAPVRLLIGALVLAESANAQYLLSPPNNGGQPQPSAFALPLAPPGAFPGGRTPVNAER
jgi:hypothetical protein